MGVWWYLAAAIVCLTMAAGQKPNIDNRRHDVYIAGFFPYGRGVENSNTGRGVMPSVKLALDHVNDHSGVLRNYRLHMWWNDTEINPEHTVPTLDDDGFILWESRAICAYLVSTYAKDDLMYPKDPKKRAIVDQRLYFDCATLFPKSRNIFYPVVHLGETTISEENRKSLNEGLSFLNTFLEGHDWVAGDNMTIADISLYAMVSTLECNAAVGVKAFFDMMHSGPHKLMLFGAACTHVTDPIAKASKHWHLTQLSYADTHPMFTSDTFPNFFRIVPSETAFNPPRLALLRRFNWTRVGTIYQNEPRYSLAHNRLVADLDTINAEIAETQSFANDVTAALTKLKDKDVRVILGNFDEAWARRIFCEAYRVGMYGKKYQWLIMGTYSESWWLRDTDYGNCSADEVAAALEQTLLTDLLPLSTTGEITVSGITADEYKFEYDSRRGSEYSRFHGYTYDGIWAVALAIQHVAHKIKLFRRNQTVIDFRYRDPLWEQLFLDALGNTSFEGVTGPVRFYGNERKASILLKQFQDGNEVKVGEYNAATDHLDLTLGAPLKWLGKHPPKDRTLEIIEHSQVNKTLYAVLASCAGVGIVMASVFLAVNIKYRNQRYIKMSSPQLNNLIIVGCMLTYTSVVFLGLDSGLSSVAAFPYICTARAWTLMAGFSLAFGAMFSKTWRVHSIFTDVKLNKKVIKDYQLFMVVGVLLFIDLVIMTTWQVADPFYRATKQLEPYLHPSSDDIIIIQENEYCQSERMTIFIVSIYIYKGLLMILGAFLAWETRHVSIPALNDSRHVGLSVYNVVIVCVCGAAVALVLNDRRDAAFAIISVFIIFCTTTTLCLVFVPKLVELKRNPAGGADRRCRPTLRPMSKTRRDSSELEHRLREVKTCNSKFRKTLLERESELQMLIRSLGSDAQDILDTKDNKCLSVPLLRREATSVTEPSDTTSLCSLSSAPDGTGKKRVHITGSTPTPTASSPALTPAASSTKVSAPSDVKGSSSSILSTTSKDMANQKDTVNSGVVISSTKELGVVRESYKHDRLVPNMTTHQHSFEVPEVESPRVQKVPQMVKSVEFLNHDICIQNVIPSGPNYLDNECLPDIPPTISKSQTESIKFASKIKYDGTKHERTKSEGTRIEKMKYDQQTTVDGYIIEGVSSDQYDHIGKSKQVKYDVSLETSKDGYSSEGSKPQLSQRRSSVRTDVPIGADTCHRRVSMPGPGRCTRRATDFNTHLVAKSELWDTGTQHRCSQSKHKTPRSSLQASQPDVANMDPSIHRSVSEKNRHASLRSGSYSTTKSSQSDTKSPPKLPTIGNQECSKYGYVQSSPNVAGAAVGAARNRDMYAASSESELLDGAILPIFQKLLTERKKSQQHVNLSYGQSCPNISIKCDIVEYL